MRLFRRESQVVRANVYLVVAFPVSSARLAAILGVAADLWPGCFCGVVADGVVVSEGPMGKDPMPCGQAVLELLSPSGPKGNRWGEQRG